MSPCRDAPGVPDAKVDGERSREREERIKESSCCAGPAVRESRTRGPVRPVGPPGRAGVCWRYGAGGGGVDHPGGEPTFVINCHFHDDRSSDGREPLSAHCEAARAAGVRDICVTNHAEVLAPDGSWQADLAEMRDRFARVRESVLQAGRDFPELRVRFGIELEYRREWTETFDRLTAALPFDFVLGSVHMVDGFNVSGGPHRDSYFEGRTQAAAYERYFRELDEMVEWGGFDVVAHFDLVKRFGHRHYGVYDPAAFRSAIQPVLERMAERGLGIEINTSGVNGPGSPYPEAEILRWARECGVPALTIGTDSHAPRAFAQGLREGIALAAEAGWAEFTVYEGRRPEVTIPGSAAAAWARRHVAAGDDEAPTPHG